MPLSLFVLATLAALDPHVLSVWISAHPWEAFVALGAVLNVLNGLLPATIRTGPVGTALHVALDRLTILTRRNAPGTLKWPIIAGSILRAVADSLNPPTPLAIVAEKQGALDVSASRPSVAPPAPTPADGVGADEPEPFDPHARQTITPPDRQRGSVDVRSLLAVVVAVVCVAGCPVVREAAMRAAPGVPDPVDCAPGVQRCDGNAPVVCSATHREWPALPRRASGEPRTCAPGVCVVDGGVAYCDLSARDGGAE